MFAHAFVRHAFLAGSLIALASGLIGYFLVLRSQVFASDALSHAAFTGALGAAAVGLDLRVGLFAVTVVTALAMGGLGRRVQADDVTIGSVFAWVLGLGVLCLALFTTNASSTNGAAGVRVLFGSIYGLSAADAWLAAAIGAALSLLVIAVARPLLFASADSAVAGARAVPVRMLGLAFLVLVGVDTAEATQAVGALLVLGLLATPAGAAHRLTANPYLALGLSGMLAVASMWIGLLASYLIPTLPPSFTIIAAATLIYIAAVLAGRRDWRTCASNAAVAYR